MFDRSDVKRRDVLAGLGALALAGGSAFEQAVAAESSPQAFDYFLETFAGSPENPRLWARGARAIAQLPGTAPGPIYAEVGIWATAVLSAPDELMPAEWSRRERRQAKQLAVRYTGLILQPWTMQPLAEFENPENGARSSIPVVEKDSRWLAVPGRYRDLTDPDASSSQFDCGWVRSSGGKTTSVAIRSWRIPEEPLAAADAIAIQTFGGRGSQPVAAQLNQSIQFPAHLEPWLGYSRDDQVLVAVNATASAIAGADEAPDLLSEILERSPSRLQIPF